MANKLLEILVVGVGPSGLAFSLELAQQVNANMYDLRVTIRDKRIEKVSEENSFRKYSSMFAHAQVQC
jgi:flavin-dependent dehydrogenase